jgi:peroxiredoxin
MTVRNGLSPLKVLLLAVLLAFIGAAGLLTGRLVRSLRDPGATRLPGLPSGTANALTVGDELPDVEVEAGDGRILPIRSLIGTDGAVLLFLDLDCPPCIDMAAKWQRTIDEGEVDPDRVLAVTASPAESPADEAYDRALDRAFEHGLRLRLVVDREAVFTRRHGIVSFPYAVIVDRSGHVRFASADSTAPVDLDVLELILGP